MAQTRYDLGPVGQLSGLMVLAGVVGFPILHFIQFIFSEESGSVTFPFHSEIYHRHLIDSSTLHT